MAEYDQQDFAAVGAQLAALSVDEPVRAEAMRRERQLSFPILCDPQREVVTGWGLLNTQEYGGIAYPAVFIIDGSRTVRYRSLDRTAARVSSDAVMDFLKGGMRGVNEPARARARWPGFGNFLRATKNMLRFGVRVSKK